MKIGDCAKFTLGRKRLITPQNRLLTGLFHTKVIARFATLSDLIKPQIEDIVTAWSEMLRNPEVERCQCAKKR